MDFQKNVVLFSDPKGYRSAIETYLTYFNAKPTIDKSVGGIVAFDQIAVAAAGQNIAEFFRGAVTTARTNLQSFDRPQSEHFIITHMKMLEGVNATLTETVWSPGFLDGDLQNGDWTFDNNGVIEQQSIPGTVFQPAAENPFSGIYELALPIVWRGQTRITIRMNYRNVPSTANTNQRVELWGLGYLS